MSNRFNIIDVSLKDIVNVKLNWNAKKSEYQSFKSLIKDL